MTLDEYRAYVIGPDGHIIKRIDIRCSDKQEARRLAKVVGPTCWNGLSQSIMSRLRVTSFQ